MSDNLKAMQECGLLPEGEIPTNPVEMFVDHQELKECLEEYTSRILTSQQAAHAAEIARLKEENELLRQAAKEPAMLEFTARLLGEGQADSLRKYMQETKEQLSAANAACAMMDEALKELLGINSNESLYDTVEKWRRVDFTKQVSEWERKQLEPLQAQVAMWTAIAKGLSFGTDWNSGTHAKIYRPKLLAALSNTQATAEQFIAECEQRGAVKARDTAIHEYLIDQMNRDYSAWPNQDVAQFMPEFFHRLHAEFWDSINATSKKAW